MSDNDDIPECGASAAPASSDHFDEEMLQPFKGKKVGFDISAVPDSMTHRLSTKAKGESEVEMLAQDMENRRNGRVKVPYTIRTRLLHSFKKISNEKGYSQKTAVQVSDVYDFRDIVKGKVESGENYKFTDRIAQCLYFANTEKTALEVLDRAIETIEDLDMKKDDMWFFTDFIFYHTETVAFIPIFRHPLLAALFWAFFFYIGTPILFCSIYQDEGICPNDPTPQNRRYYGVVSSMYFASTTMSTVGYGDLSVSKDARWKVFLGILYMIVAMLVAVMALGAISDTSISKFKGVCEGFLHRLALTMRDKMGMASYRDMLLYQRIRLLKYVKLGDILLQFLCLNCVGVFFSRIFVNRDPLMDWTWMDSFYWAIQTTTTIGYGDMYMSFEMRWFQIFYLVGGTMFVGYALGKLGSLRDELSQMKREYAWERRETDRAMVEQMQGGAEHDGRVDQYEFVLASLLMMNKIDASEVTSIMDKYRDLVSDSGFIELDDVVETKLAQDTLDEEEAFEFEGLDAEGHYKGMFMRAMSMAKGKSDTALYEL
uniref:Potassium channel domain-containing protein n=1 Tax=Odontella aurita TaxID=265563 RepID=A0A7S4KC64_9STRA|mmetsp:Transcript_8830/g.26465  ORF Transcript_8830/g.26465 Transcript_8830/m.26465 type:complete len:542 (+) Transcript_8830:306-1931(+)